MSLYLSRFVLGARAPLIGLKSLISGPKIFWLALVPAFVSSGFFVFGLVFGLRHVSEWLTLATPAGEDFLGTILHWTLTVMGYVFFVVTLLLVVFVVSKIIVVPFNSLISERVLRYYGCLDDKPLRFVIWIKRSVKMIMWILMQAAFFLVLSIGLFALSFVPIVNLVVVFIGFLVVAFDCSDYAMDLAELDFKQKLVLMKRRLPEFCGFATVIGLTFMIPFLNFFLLPISVSGASWLVSTFDELWAKQRTT